MTDLSRNPGTWFSARLRVLALVLCFVPGGARALDSPWISDTFFYWYTWDRAAELGAWTGGVHNTPLEGYYDSRTFRDNYRSLQVASEWGITHHFMDYWSPDWKGEDGEMREKTVMRAAEALRREGYDIWMSYYQDGKNFEMGDFALNVSERRDVYQWLRDFSRSPVWPRVQGKPIQLVYGRNGHPKPSRDVAAFRAWLEERYGGAAALNAAWGAEHASLAEIGFSSVEAGRARADWAEFLFADWRRRWAELESLVREEFGLPGMVASFDVAYRPYRNLGYIGLTRTFAGPHSYGGLFGPPHDQDVERFIQVQVAKHYDSVFFDHFKNFYHDWDIRIPGMAYLPDPFNFDRCWTIALMHRAEALLHMSWNEWWEGSNLEPSTEFGKTYCEKNLFYATLMKRFFTDIWSARLTAPVGVVLNDYAFRAGTSDPDDLYRALTALRRLGIEFDLIPDDLLSARELARFEVVIAPSCGIGFGRTGEGREVIDLLLSWSEAGGTLVFSAAPGLADRLGFAETAAEADLPPAPRGGDLNVFVDVGTQGDDRFLLSGRSHREDWQILPPGKFGAGKPQTVRWTPGVGKRSTLALPCSPGRKHVLRFSGNAIWPNTLRVSVNGNPVGEIAIREGSHDYEVVVNAEAVGSRRLARVVFTYARQHVPGRKDPDRFGSEARTCNLALDWLQFSTANVPRLTTAATFTMPKLEVVFAGADLPGLDGVREDVAYASHPVLRADRARTLSTYSDGAPRDLLTPFGKGRLLYVNGGFADFAKARELPPERVTEGELAYWREVLRSLGGVSVRGAVTGMNVGGVKFRAGGTDVLFAYNYAEQDPTHANLSVPVRKIPLSEATVLSADGRMYRPLEVARSADGERWEARVPLSYYGVYGFVHAPVRIACPPLECLAGERRLFETRATNLTSSPVELSVQVTSILPTVTGERVSLSLEPGGEKTVELPISIGAGADWGVKTVTIEVSWGDQIAYFVRPLTVLSAPELAFDARISAGGKRRLSIRQQANPFGAAAAAVDLKLRWQGKVWPLGDLGPGLERVLELGPPPAAAAPAFAESAGVLSYVASWTTRSIPVALAFPALPKVLPAPFPRAAPVLVSNSGSDPLGPFVVGVELKPGEKLRQAVDADGHPVATQVARDGRSLRFAAVAPGGDVAVYWLGEERPAVSPPTDLVSEVRGKPGSGNGEVTVANSFFRVVISEQAGGTITRLVSLRTGRDYAADSFDLNAGQFVNPEHSPYRSTTVQYIREVKQYMSDEPALFTDVERGPLSVSITVRGKLAGVTHQTRYEFQAYSDAFRITREAEIAAGDRPQEVVVLDTALRPHRLSKSYPGFAGILSSEPKCHFGWRYSDYVPDLISLINPGGYDEAISLLVVTHSGIDRVRQGFWPARRPEPGPREAARIEFISRGAGSASLTVDVRIHPGYHREARRWREARRKVWSTRIDWLKRPAVRPLDLSPGDWWHPSWPFRGLIDLGENVPPAGERVAARLTSAGLYGDAGFDPASVRLFAETGQAARELLCSVDPDASTVSWRVPAWGADVRRYSIYFARRGGAARPASPLRGSVPRVIVRFRDDLESGDHWQLGGVSLREDGGVEGSRGLFFAAVPADRGPRVTLCRTGVPLPDTEYRLRFQARTTAPGAALRANFYAGADCDFPQVRVPLTADGKWHSYETKLPGGPIPDGAAPRLRLWTLPGCGPLSVDEIVLEAMIPEGDGIPVREARVEALPQRGGH